jgi:hypothetical protein
VIALMKISKTWDSLQRHLTAAYPKYGEQHLLDLYGDDDEAVAMQPAARTVGSDARSGRDDPAR